MSVFVWTFCFFDVLHSPFASSRSLWKCSVDLDPCPAPLPIVLCSDSFWKKLWNKPACISLCSPVKPDTNNEHLTDFVVSSLFNLYSCPSKTWAIFSAPLVSVCGFICFSKLFTAIMFKWTKPCFNGFKDIWERLQHPSEPECRISGDGKGWMDEFVL